MTCVMGFSSIHVQEPRVGCGYSHIVIIDLCSKWRSTKPSYSTVKSKGTDFHVLEHVNTEFNTFFV